MFSSTIFRISLAGAKPNQDQSRLDRSCCLGLEPALLDADMAVRLRGMDDPWPME